jgi:hypothetical protein
MFPGATVDHYGSTLSRGSNAYQEYHTVVMLPNRVSSAHEYSTGYAITLDAETAEDAGRDLTSHATLIQAAYRVRPGSNERHIIIIDDGKSGAWWEIAFPDAVVTTVNADALVWQRTGKVMETSGWKLAFREWFQGFTWDGKAMPHIEKERGVEKMEYYTGVVNEGRYGGKPFERSKVYYVERVDPRTGHPPESFLFSAAVTWLASMRARDAQRWMPTSVVKTSQGNNHVCHMGALTIDAARLWFACLSDAPTWFELDGQRHPLVIDPLFRQAIEAIGRSVEPPSLTVLATALDVTRQRLTRVITNHGVTDVKAWIAEQHALALARMAERREVLRDRIPRPARLSTTWRDSLAHDARTAPLRPPQSAPPARLGLGSS